MNATNRVKGWLLPAALILFLLEILLFPFAAQLTYAGRSDSPNHVLTYSAHRLTWDSATDVDPVTGVAELSLFNSSYSNVQSGNGDKVVAPGTEATNIVRLQNNARSSITYIAVMYRVKEEDTLPVAPVLTDRDAFRDTETYPLPEGVTQDQVVRAVTGSVKAGQMQDFDITWLWEYYESDQRDALDTALGNKAAWEIPDEVMAGLYIVVEEASRPGPVDPDDPDEPDEATDPADPDSPDGSGDPGTSDDSYTYPDVPYTGDSSHIVPYLVLMGVSGVLLLILLLERRKAKQ